MATSNNRLTPIVHGGSKRKNSGIILRQGDEFIVTSRRELNERGIKTRRTGREVVFGGKTRQVYEKKNWDYCNQIRDLFRDYKHEHGVLYKLDAFLVTEIVVSDITGTRVIHPQWCETW